MGILRTIIDQPEEVPPLVQMAWAAHKAKRLPKEPNLAFCYDMLNRVSRRYFHDHAVVGLTAVASPLIDCVCADLLSYTASAASLL